MIYRIVSYDRITERMKGSLIVPPGVLGQVKVIAGFQQQDDGLGEYPLDEEQTRRVATFSASGRSRTDFITRSSHTSRRRTAVFREQIAGASGDDL